jgi:cytoskeletal protein RodZ
MNRVLLIIIVLLLMVCVLGIGCLIGIVLFSGNLSIPGMELFATSTTTYTPIPSPTVTDVPTATPTLEATATPTLTQAPPTETSVPPTATATKQPSPTEAQIAEIKIVNNLPVALTIKLRGPVDKTVTVQASSTYEFQIEPGTYTFTLSAPGYSPLYGTKVFDPGDNKWTIGKAP